MKFRIFKVLLACSIFAPLSFAGGESPVKNPVKNPVKYEVANEILFKGKGGWDDLSFEPSTHRLFVSHSDRVIVIDTEDRKVIAEIDDTVGVHGIALASDLGKAFSSNGKEGQVSVIDLKTLKTQMKITVGQNPDAIIYNQTANEIYCFNGTSHSVSIIDAKLNKLVSTLALPGKPEFATLDSNANRVYVNVEDQNSIVAIDTQTHKIAASWPLKGCESPSGIAIDKKDHRLLSVCENEKMVMVNSENGHIIASVKTGRGTDGAAFDPELGLAFAPNGKDGTLSVIKVEAQNLTLVENLKTQIGARTMTIDLASHRLFLPTARFGPIQNGRPQPIENSQKVLVISPKP